MNKLFLCVALFLTSVASATEIEEVEFVSQGTTLSGSFVFPTHTEIKAAVIFVHGSGKQPRFMQGAGRFARDGIASFVYDKRGVGKSGGEYEGNQSVSEANLNLLAEDALAAFNTLAAHPKLKDVPLGLTGISQAGWIIPITASKASNVDFLVIWSGPVCKVSEEDIYSKFTRDYDADQVPSYSDALAARTSPYVWPNFLGKDTDPSEYLKQMDIPGLWIFGAQDGSVPIDLSVQNLDALIKTKPHYEYILFSKSGHNNLYETFATANDWIIRLSQE